MRKNIDRHLACFLNDIARRYQWDRIHPALKPIICEYNLRPGKRLRPLLMVLTYTGYKQGLRRVPAHIYRVCTCIELLHNFMLIHDDIIDRADLRRGRPTMHRALRRLAGRSDERSRLGEDLAIIIGDIIYAMAFEAFLSVRENAERKEQALRYFIRTAIYTALGELIDTLHGKQPITRVHEEDVLMNYTMKTAYYTFDCPMVVGALLAGAPQTDIRRLTKIGVSVGQAFQMQDDVIGLFDSQKNIGKSILSDLAESKKTILIIHAARTLRGRSRAAFDELFDKPRKTMADLHTMRRLLISSGSLAYALTKIRNRLADTRRHLNRLTLKDRQKNIINNLMSQLFQPTARIAGHYGIADVASFLD